MSFLYPRRKSFPRPTVVHHIVCRHQVEIEVYPARAEVYFRDERHTDPVNTIFRYHANVYNAPSSRVIWNAQAVDGGPSAGSIDQTGLYLAPPKGSLGNGTTDVIIATAADNPLRKAFATVTLVGVGPVAPVPEKLEIFPKQAYVYYSGHYPAPGCDNNFIDLSNKAQLFRANIYHSTEKQIEWFVDGSKVNGANEAWYLYRPNSPGNDNVQVAVGAQLFGKAETYDEARIVLINYYWLY